MSLQAILLKLCGRTRRSWALARPKTRTVKLLWWLTTNPPVTGLDSIRIMYHHLKNKGLLIFISDCLPNISNQSRPLFVNFTPCKTFYFIHYVLLVYKVVLSSWNIPLLLQVDKGFLPIRFRNYFLISLLVFPLVSGTKIRIKMTPTKQMDPKRK